MADPVQKPDISSAPAAPKLPPSAPKPKATVSAPDQVKAKPKEASGSQSGKKRLEPLNVNLGRCGLPQESAFPVQREAKTAPKPAATGKPAAGAKPAPGAKGAPAPKSPAPAAKGAVPAKTDSAAAPGAVLKKSTPKAKSQYFIIENLCVGCGLCLDKCPPKVNAIGYKFYGDVQEGGFRAYIDQDACISCAACFSSDECPSSALIEVRPDGDVLDFTYTPSERLDFDLRFLHRFHREAR